MHSRWRWMRRRWFVMAGIGIAVLWGMSETATTRQGINFHVSVQRIPVYVKTIDFLHRHFQYQRMAQQIVQGVDGDQARALAVFRWTREHIPETPAGWPIVDDHVLNIIIRGHGVEDQMADVFTTLLTYAGVPAFWKLVRDVPGGRGLILSFAKVDGAWRVFDVAHGVVFADAHGRLLALDSLLRDPTLVTAVANPTARQISYAGYLESLRPFTVPDVLRAEQQMPWPRLIYEMRRAMAWRG